MGTRGLYGLRKDGIDKTTYNHYDSYPECLGANVLEFCAMNTVEDMKKIYDNIVLVDEREKPNEDQIKMLKEAGYLQGEADDRDWYWALRGEQGYMDKYPEDLKAGRPTYMIDNHEFIIDSLFCEYAYIINLDEETLEVYTGFQKQGHYLNRYGALPDRNGYYPCREIFDIPLDIIHIDDIPEWVERMKTAIEINR